MADIVVDGLLLGEVHLLGDILQLAHGLLRRLDVGWLLFMDDLHWRASLWLEVRVLVVVPLHVHGWNAVWPLLLLVLLTDFIPDLCRPLNLCFFVCSLFLAVHLPGILVLLVHLLAVIFLVGSPFADLIQKYTAGASTFLLRMVFVLQQLSHEFRADLDCLLLVLKIRSLFPLGFDFSDVGISLLWVKRIHDFPEEVALWESLILAYRNKFELETL